MSSSEPIVVIALGSRYRGDDGVGPSIADRLKGRLKGIVIIEGQNDAMAIVSAWEGAALAIVVDAAASGAPPGTIHRLEVDARPLPKDMVRCSSHGLGLAEAVEMGNVLKRLPDQLLVYAIEAKTFDPGTALSREVTIAAEEVARMVEAEIALSAKI